MQAPEEGRTSPKLSGSRETALCGKTNCLFAKMFPKVIFVCLILEGLRSGLIWTRLGCGARPPSSGCLRKYTGHLQSAAAKKDRHGNLSVRSLLHLGFHVWFPVRLRQLLVSVHTLANLADGK